MSTNEAGDVVRCDDCGRENVLTELFRQTCDGCGASLAEERARPPVRSGAPGVVLVVALASTTAFVVAPTWALAVFAGPLFAVGYVVVFGLLCALAPHYQARDDYDAGAFVWDNPFTYRDDAQRAHFQTGVALIPVNLVRESWREVWAAFAGPR